MKLKSEAGTRNRIRTHENNTKIKLPYTYYDHEGNKTLRYRPGTKQRKIISKIKHRANK